MFAGDPLRTRTEIQGMRERLKAGLFASDIVVVLTANFPRIGSVHLKKMLRQQAVLLFASFEVLAGVDK